MSKNKDHIKFTDDSKLTPQELTRKLEFLVLYGDFYTLKNFLDKNKNFEFSSRALAFALSYRDSSITKLLLEHNFSLTKSNNSDNEYTNSMMEFYCIKEPRLDGRTLLDYTEDFYYKRVSKNLILSLIIPYFRTFSFIDHSIMFCNNMFFNLDLDECFDFSDLTFDELESNYNNENFHSELRVASLDERLKSLSYLIDIGHEDKDTLDPYVGDLLIEKVINYEDINRLKVFIEVFDLEHKEEREALLKLAKSLKASDKIIKFLS